MITKYSLQQPQHFFVFWLWLGGAAAVSFQPESVSASRDEILRDQDRGLDSLYHVIVRQKKLAQNIESEVGVQVSYTTTCYFIVYFMGHLAINPCSKITSTGGIRLPDI